MTEQVRPFMDKTDAQPDSSLFRQLFEQAPLPYQSLDQDGRILEVNHAWLTMLGRSREAVVGRWFGEFLDRPSQACFRERFPVLLEKGVVSCVEFRMLHRDGETVDISLDGRIARDAQGRFQRSHCILHDITARKRAEQQIRLSEARWRSLTETSPDHILLLDAELTIRYANCAFQGLSMEALIGTPLYDYVEPARREEIRAILEGVLESGEPANYESSYQAPDGSSICYESRVAPRRIAGSDDILGLTLSTRDVTQRRSLEDQLRRRNAELETLINAIPAPVYFEGADGCYRMVNLAYCEFVGLPQEEIIGRSNIELFPEDVATHFLDSDRQVLERGQTIADLEQRVPDVRGRLRWVSTTKTPLPGPGGDIEGLVGISFDITENKQAEERRLAREKEHRDALVQEVHHRIKNHLQGVVGLLRQQLHSQAGAVEIVGGAIDRIRTIAAVYGLKGEQHGGVCLCDLIAATMEIHRGNSGGSAVDYSHQKTACSVLIEQESVPLALVINELITNAVKHNLQDHARAPVRVELTTHGAAVCLRMHNRARALPEAFDLDSGTGLGTGLRLLRSLLPHRGCRLSIQLADGWVVTELTLEPPVVTGLMD